MASAMEKPDDPGGGKVLGQQGSYADRLKTNVKYDQRLKRNVLEIVIEKSEREAEIVLDPATVARVCRSVGLDIDSQVEGYQVQFGRVCILSVWVEKSVSLERFCRVENIMVSKGVMTGSIRPSGRKDVVVTVAGLDFNTPDTLIQEYIVKFGAKLMSPNVMYSKYTEGPFKGKFNGERKYQVDFTEATTNMGTYHFIDGSRIRVFYRGNTKTCGRCHKSSGQCPGDGVARECEEQGGERVHLSDHMRSLWAFINFNPTSFKLPETTEDMAGGGDKPISDVRIPKVIQAPMSEADKGKLVGIRINNFPLEMSEEEILEFLKENVSRDIGVQNLEIIKSGRNSSVSITSGLTSEIILAAMAAIDFKESRKIILEKPLYCRPIRNITPVKTPTAKSPVKSTPANSPPAKSPPAKSPLAKSPPEKIGTKPKIVPQPKIGGVPSKAQAQAIERRLEKEKKKGANKKNKTPTQPIINKYFTPEPPKSEFAKLLEERSRSVQRTPGSTSRSTSSQSPNLRKRNSSELDSPTSPDVTLEMKKNKVVSGIPLKSK